MLQVRVHGPGDVRVDEVAEPRPGRKDVIVRVAACGICGSDVSYIKMGGIAGPTGTPMCLGHEMAGVVDWVGPDVTTAHVGDRVVVQPGSDQLGRIGNGAPEGGLTPLLLVTEADRGRLHHVPDDLAIDVAAFAEPLAVGMHAADQAEVQPGEGVAVFGCGPIGLAAIATLIDRGHERVVAVDLSSTRLDLALELGAQAALDPGETDVWEELARLHGTAPFTFGPTPATSAYIEASGWAGVIGDVLDHAPVGGRLSVVALHYDPIPTSYLMLLMKQFTIRGSMEYPPRFGDAIDLLARTDLSALITHRFPLERFGDALTTLERSEACGKVLVTIDPDQR
ncbi:MAG TPA: alcohol dehydrogenase catalytic domain-containing protein [Acidimicrobiales bacterium]|jgi:threonine dehydrogenase-like Zn-dependent dehydrogenase|nr:alcohol dehydrogenase catalytic domain-containing protein [Acidimicrobiales bacterium]